MLRKSHQRAAVGSSGGPASCHLAVTAASDRWGAKDHQTAAPVRDFT